MVASAGTWSTMARAGSCDLLEPDEEDPCPRKLIPLYRFSKGAEVTAPRKAPARKTAQPAPRKTTARKPAARKATQAQPRKAAAKRAPAKKVAAPRKAAATKAGGLRVVRPGEKPPVQPERQLTITEAAEANDERALLVGLRKKLAQTIQDSSTPARDQASLSIRLLQINKDIQALDARSKEEDSDAESVEDETFDPEAL